MGVSLGGFFSGMDTQGIIAQLTELNKMPIYTLQREQANNTEQSGAFGFVQSSLSSLRTNLTSLNDSYLYSSKAATTSSSDVGTVSVDTTASSGSVTLNVTQVASASMLRSGKAGGTAADTKLTALPAVGDSISKILGTTDFVGKTFSVNGSVITLASGETVSSLTTKLQGVLGGAGASYDATTGKFTLSSGSAIILGSAADTSDFLARAQLFNNGTGSIISSTGVGRVDTTTALTASGWRSGLTLTSGTFTVNGVSVSYAAGDSLDTVLSNITSSSAGVVATYDNYSDQIVLSNKNRGALNITVADGTSNFASAMRLGSADNGFTLGSATKFTVGTDPTVRQSDDQTLTAAEMGLTGVTFTAIATGTTTLTVSPDTDKVKKAIDAFITQYNSAQNLVQSYVKVDPADLTKNGLLASDSSLSYLPTSLRSTTTSATTNSGTIRMLEDLGITGNSTDNTLTVSDSSKLEAALKDHLQEVVDLFSEPTTGLNYRLGSFLDAYTTANTGVLASRQTSLSSRNKQIDEEIARVQAQVTAEEAYLKAAFGNMEQASGTQQQFSSFFK